MRILFLSSLLAVRICAHAGADGRAPADTAGRAALKVMEKRVMACLRRDPDSALIHARQYQQLAIDRGSAEGMARAENLLGLPLTMKGDHAGALPHYLAALEGFERLGDRTAAAIVLASVANAYAGQDRLAEAAAQYRLAIEAYRRMGEPLWEAGLMRELAKVHKRMGSEDSAAVLLGKAADLLVRGGSTAHAAMARYDQAEALRGNAPDTARVRMYREALDLLGPDGDRPLRCSILFALGRTLKGVGRSQEALAVFTEAAGLTKEYGLTQGIADAHLELSDLFAAAGGTDSALAHLRSHLQWRDSVYSEERAKAMADAEQRYASGRKDLEIERNKAQLERRGMVINAVAAIAVLALIAGLLAFRAYRMKRRWAEELARKNAVINEQLKEKEVLLREIHHRVKNNLQTITSLLRLQSRSLKGEEGRNAIEDAMSRVRSMSLIHQDLYHRPGLTSVDMGAYMTKLTNALLRSHGMEQRIDAHVEVGTLELDVEPAVTLGLVANELITNALKHAFPGDRSGALWITLTEEGEEIRLEVRDNGIGFEPGAVTIAKEGAASGVDIVHAMAGALQAELSIKREKGTRVRLRFRHNSRVAAPAQHAPSGRP